MDVIYILTMCVEVITWLLWSWLTTAGPLVGISNIRYSSLEIAEIAMSVGVTVRKQNVTDRQTEGRTGGVSISPVTGLQRGGR